MEKYCGVEQVPDDNITRRMRIACWIPKATNTHSEYVMLIDFLQSKGMKPAGHVAPMGEERGVYRGLVG